MADMQWRIVDVPLRQPREDDERFVFADKGPWNQEFSLALKNAQWIEKLGRLVWIEGSGNKWFDTNGRPIDPPTEAGRRKSKI